MRCRQVDDCGAAGAVLRAGFGPGTAHRGCSLGQIGLISTAQILIDGVDIKDMDVDHYRRNVVLVSQEPKLFNLSIADNIAYGLFDPRPTDVRLPCFDCLVVTEWRRAGCDPACSRAGERGDVR